MTFLRMTQPAWLHVTACAVIAKLNARTCLDGRTCDGVSWRYANLLHLGSFYIRFEPAFVLPGGAEFDHSSHTSKQRKAARLASGGNGSLCPRSHLTSAKDSMLTQRRSEQAIEHLWSRRTDLFQRCHVARRQAQFER